MSRVTSKQHRIHCYVFHMNEIKRKDKFLLRNYYTLWKFHLYWNWKFHMKILLFSWSSFIVQSKEWSNRKQSNHRLSIVSRRKYINIRKMTKLKGFADPIRNDSDRGRGSDMNSVQDSSARNGLKVATATTTNSNNNSRSTNGSVALVSTCYWVLRYYKLVS